MTDQDTGLGAKLRESVRDGVAAEEERKKREVVEVSKELLSHNFDRASAYTNVVILAGYAGLFGIWSLTNEQLDVVARAWIALLLVISIAVYVGFEVLKMIAFSFVMRAFVRTIAAAENSSPDQFLNARAVAKTDERNISVALFPIWQVVLVVVCASGLGAAIILIANFVGNVLA